MIKQRYVAPAALTALAAGSIVRRARIHRQRAPLVRRRLSLGRRRHH